MNLLNLLFCCHILEIRTFFCDLVFNNQYFTLGDVGSEEEDENVDSNVCINNEEENTDL